MPATTVPSKTPETSPTASQPTEESSFQYLHPVAICTLADEALREKLSTEPALKDVLVASLHTENIGIEQIIEFSLSQPHLRYIILCGRDARQAIGHLPGQTLKALSERGVDATGRIIEAPGKRPFIKNLTLEAIEHFRRSVSIIDHIDDQSIDRVLQSHQFCLENNPGLAPSFTGALKPKVPTLQAQGPEAMTTDPAGYFLVELDRQALQLVLKHYNNDGQLNLILTGPTCRDLYFAAMENQLISLLDHAAYLGRELYRAEVALKSNGDYIQDDWAISEPA